MRHPSSPRGSTGRSSVPARAEPRTITKWVQEGRLWRKYRGVYAYGQPHLSREGEWMAAMLAAGDGAVLAGMCSASKLRITKLEPREIQVIVPGPSAAAGRVPAADVPEPEPARHRDRRPHPVHDRRADARRSERRQGRRGPRVHDPRGRVPGDLLARGDCRRRWRARTAAEPRRARRGAGAAPERERRDAQPAREALPAAGAGRRAARAGSNIVVNGFEVDFYWPGLCVEIDGPSPRRGRGRRSTTGSATPRCGPRATSCCASRGRPQRAARDGPSGARGAAACRRRCAVGRRRARSSWGP